MVHRSKPKLPIVRDPKPSQVTDADWLRAERKAGEYPDHTERGGKWLVFVNATHVDEVWAKIKDATEKGLLGGLAKVSTAMSGHNTTNPDSKVICVYTYDWTDEEDVRRVRGKLRELGILAKIPYKADSDTLAGSYAIRDKRISKYYE